MIDTLIVGAGISGLSAAYRLDEKQRQVLVAEKRDRAGGNITSQQSGDFLWEEGPNSFSPTPELLKLAVDAGLRNELIFADRGLPRYVYWEGKLRPVPMSPPTAVTSQLLSPIGKLRALTGALGFIPPQVSSQEETVADFFTRHLGSEVAQRLVSPFVSGVYAGDVDQLSAEAAFGRVTQLADVGGGLVAGAILCRRQKPKSTPKTAKPSDIPETKSGQLGSFKEGLQQLPSAIVSQLGDKVKFQWELKNISPHPESGYVATFSTPEGEQTVEAKTVILTTPAYVTASLVKDLSPQASQALNEISYPPVACVVLAYPDEALRFPLKGFGNLNPRSQGIRTLGTIWSSTLFPGRTPKGWHLLTNFIGGATDPAIAELSEDQIIEQVHQDLQQAVIKSGSIPKPLAVHLWSKAIPQYNLGHLKRLETIRNHLKPFSGLFLSSNYLDGVALGDCVRRGEESSQAVLDYLG
ncbi:protoporphyrinogen oxidase [Halothece sp. PCC 7418]|uniref:protoporphyrinogen oxidase n=1 Tax=Halothece sp. (strain PCC 7418) TaxID=65093 RepID=UPI0002A05DE4|nr:protoporphyrinogen oxidase [Halothece sp. PCC 7418]AFZ43049.1 protoporphyrinogen oxidase [Halothece sp. PCC 7418]